MMSKKVVLRFGKDNSGKPIVYQLVKEFNLVLNIIKARVSPEEEGLLILELFGEKEDYDKGIKFLKSNNISIQPFEKEICRSEENCIDCTACIAHCPTKALDIKDRKSMEINFDAQLCVACEACVMVCPFEAMNVKF